MAAVSPLEIWRWHLSGWNDFFDRDKTITANILAGRRWCLGWGNCAVLSVGRALPVRRLGGCFAPPGAAKQGAPYVAGFPALRSWETAVTSCAGANGLVRRMLLGTPRDGQSAALPPVI